MSHEPECDEAWKWPDFMSGRGIEDEHCWMCGLLRRVREDERQRMPVQYLVSDREQQEGEQRAYKRGLAAARDAIRNVPCPDGYEAKGCSHWDQALAAIDALREGEK